MTGSFAQAVAKREPDTALDTRTGEMFDPATADHGDLVDIFTALQNAEKQFKEWRTAVEDELVRRHGDRRAAQVIGDHEVDVDRGYSRVWDLEDLHLVAEDLVADGKLSATDAAALFVEQDAYKVDGRKAQALLNRATDDALVELRRCFSWQQKGRAKVKVTPVSTLDQPQVEGETP